MTGRFWSTGLGFDTAALTSFLFLVQVNNRKYPKLKEVDDVLGGAAAWENVDSTAGKCCWIHLWSFYLFAFPNLMGKKNDHHHLYLASEE